MCDQTLLMYFELAEVSEESIDEIVKIGKICFTSPVCGDPSINRLNNNLDLIIIKSETGESAVIHLYKDKKYFTLDIHSVEDSDKVLYGKRKWDLKKICGLEDQIAAHLGNQCKTHHAIAAPVNRSPDTLWRYFVTADQRIFEGNYDKLVVDVKSQYQTVKIYHSPEHGHILFLDDDVMFGECDQVAYTHTLLGLPENKNRYKGKKIIILGGGDGGVVKEIVDCEPELVIMAEIDKEVIKACRTHMRSACGDSMDTFETANKKIIVGDCLAVLDEHIKKNDLFDFVINDLTECPVNKAERGWGYDFETHCNKTFELSLLALKPEGRYLARGGSLSATDFWKPFEADVKTKKCVCKATDVYVPSFEETYRLYEVWRDQ